MNATFPSFTIGRLPRFTALKCAGSVMAAVLATNPVAAQVFSSTKDWKEADVPPPPAYDMAKLVKFDVAQSSSLVYGVDPASLSISKSDGVVRYVVVASNAGGAKNVMYEGLRCATAEVRTYARAKSDGTWMPVENPAWKSIYDRSVSRHSLRFAKSGACDGPTPARTVRDLVKKLTSPGVDGLDQ